MTSTPTTALTTPIDGLLAAPTSRLPYQNNVLLRSYVVQRPHGNLIVYNSPGIHDAAADIQALGEPSRLLINHSHESMYGQNGLNVPTWIHEKDCPDVTDTLRITGTFDKRTMIHNDLEVIPTPGHTPGTTSYLWDNGTHRFLFTGDFIWIENGTWKAVLLDTGSRQEYLDSLTLVRDLDFDVLVPWGATDDGAPIGVVKDQTEKRDRIDNIITRIETGSNR